MTRPENRRLWNSRAWPGGLEPAWAMLERASIDALVEVPSAESRALRLTADLAANKVVLSPVARNALALLREAAGGGPKLNPAGLLPRATVAAMEEAMAWPHHGPADARRGRKVLKKRL